jgi:hypothetical protein
MWYLFNGFILAAGVYLLLLGMSNQIVASAVHKRKSKYSSTQFVIGCAMIFLWYALSHS